MAVTTTAQQTAATALLSKASAAIAGNVTYLAIASPSNAQVTAQVRALTRQTNAVMRLIAGMYGQHGQLVDGTDT